jgi:2-dehydro-3-deoxygluconokinase
MNKAEKIFEELKEKRLVALLSPKSIEECVAFYEIFQSEGVVLEIALRGEFSLDGIAAVISRYPDALILAGTVMTANQAHMAIQAGAAGIVSADYIPEVVSVCAGKNIMCVPGGLADVGKQLVHKAQAYGCSLEELREKYPHQWIYKLFPAFSGSLSHMDLAQSWKGPFPDLTVMYTGGITIESLESAVLKDPRGIFCASALTQAARDVESMRTLIRIWREKLDFRPAKKAPTRFLSKGKGKSHKTVTFGEMLMRLSPPPGFRLENAQNFDVHFGGAEANVAVSLAQFGLQSLYVTVLPENKNGDNACRVLNSYGVDTRYVLRKGERIGVYYLEQGAGPRPSRVIYDRAGSAFTELKPDELDWDSIFEKTAWFHWTGITPALSGSVLDTLRKALKSAKEKGITVSCDLNFRKKLWSEERARDIMTELMSYVDVLFGNEEDPIRIFGIFPGKSDVEAAHLDMEGYRDMAQELVERFALRKVAITLRESVSASENFWSACLSDGRKFFQSKRYFIAVVDRVGAGDAFASGYIAGLLKGQEDQEALEFGVAAACLKHSIRGDFNQVSSEEVEELAAGHTSGRVQR